MEVEQKPALYLFTLKIGSIDTKSLSFAQRYWKGLQEILFILECPQGPFLSLWQVKPYATDTFAW